MEQGSDLHKLTYDESFDSDYSTKRSIATEISQVSGACAFSGQFRQISHWMLISIFLRLIETAMLFLVDQWSCPDLAIG